MRWLLFFSFLLFFWNMNANGLEVSNLSYDESANELSFDILWENPWKINTTGSNTSMDGAWVFVKYAPNGGPSWQHIDIQTASTSYVLFKAQIGNNNKGVMLSSDFCNAGNACTMVTRRVTLGLDNIIGNKPDFKVFAMEMVQIPRDPFYLGDAASYRHYHEGPDTLQPFLVNSSAVIAAGTGPGELTRKDFNWQYDIPGNYPKGYREFWAMKYKITMEQYTEFLNTLSRTAQNNRTETDISGNAITNFYVMTNSSFMRYRHPIRCDAVLSGGPVNFYCDLNENGVPNESNDGQNLIIHNISSADYLSFLDWAALRPYTKMEFEKMCRGPLMPVAEEKAWGSSGYSSTGTVLNNGSAEETFDNVGLENGLIATFNTSATNNGARVGYAATETSDRLSSGATFYGIMNLHDGGLYYFGENYNSVNNLHFFNSQGDGSLDANGNHNVANWHSVTLHQITNQTANGISHGSLVYQPNMDLRSIAYSGRGVVVLQP